MAVSGIPALDDEHTTDEGSHVLDDGVKLFTKTWKPKGPVSAKLIFVHGFSDHSNMHYTLFPCLASRGIEVFGFDQRGWGRSVTRPQDKGNTGSTTQVLADVTSVIESHLPSSVPLFLMGHSMGGALVLSYAALGPLEIRRQIAGYISESPFLAVHPASAPSRAKVIAGRIAARVMPRYQLVEKLDVALIARDPKVAEDYERDELCHDTGTLEAFAAMLDRGADLLSGKISVVDDEAAARDSASQESTQTKSNPVRLLVAHGSDDRITSFDATKEFVGRLAIKDKTFKVYEGWYHKLHAEPGDDKITFANDVADWVLSKASLATAGAAHESLEQVDMPTYSCPETSTCLTDQRAIATEFPIAKTLNSDGESAAVSKRRCCWCQLFPLTPTPPPPTTAEGSIIAWIRR